MPTSNKMLPRGLAAAVALILGTSAAQAKEVWLEARPFTPASGVLAGIPMWGYADCGLSFAGCAAAEATSPGPVISVPAEEGLTIHLRNSLADPTSIHLVGRRDSAPLPVAADALRVNGRLQAFAAEVAPGADGDYSWTAGALGAGGTFLYQSASHVQLQVQMGLYGAVTHDAPAASCATAPCAYPSVPYASSAVLVFSEVDPALHSPASAVNASPGGYQPRYFLLNGKAFDGAAPPAVNATTGDRVLLRMVNAGLESHAPQLLGGYYDVVAEDGYPAPVARSQTTALLAAAKTLDVVFTPPAAGTYPLFDRRLRLVNDDATGGGMMVRIASTGDPPPDTTPDPFVFTDLTNVAPSTLFTSNSVTIGGINTPAPISVTGGQYSVGAGAFTSAPGLVNNADSVRVQLASAAAPLTAANAVLTVGGVSDTFTVTTAAAAANNPIANPDVFYITANSNPGGNATFASPGVLANDTDPQNDALRVKVGSIVPTIPAGATLVVNTTTGANKGRVQFHAPTTSWVGDAYFTYIASEAVTVAHLDSAAATGHVVHDQHVTRTRFHNPSGTASDRWDLIGEVRGLPSATSVAVSFVQNSDNTSCTRVGEIIASVPIAASATPTTWTYGGNMANPSGCSRIRIQVAIPAANGVPAHTATYDTNFQRVNP
jgi:FtsP/CotA-like multicopper oxidase with cupredoxin domain